MKYNLKDHYNKLFLETKQLVLTDNFEIDNLIDYKNDNRYGVTLLIIPSAEVKENIQQFLTELKKVEPNQYYYRDSDIHITIMSIISCYDGFSLKNVNIEDYIKVIKKSIENIKVFTINFNGITASKSAIMLQGFPSNNSLNIIRDNLRHNFNLTVLEKTIDKRYPIKTAHSTVVRFKEKVKNINEFLEIIEKYRNSFFGEFEVNDTVFVSNDWYLKTEKLKFIDKFKLLK